jgi:hypothetical protein
MTLALVGIIVTWVCALLFLAGQHLNDIRLVFNNIAPGAQAADQPSQRLSFPAAMAALPFTFSFWDLILTPAMLLLGRHLGLDRSNAYRISGLDPARLTETGRVHLKRTIRRERILMGWMLGGFILIVWTSTYSLASQPEQGLHS